MSRPLIRSRHLLLTAVVWLTALVSAWAMVGPARAAETAPRGRLVDPAWLQQHRDEVLLLDASSTAKHRAGHIPGAVSVDLYRYGVDEAAPEAMERRIQSWGVGTARPVVVYDQGGEQMAPRLFYDLYYRGVPASNLYLLDGGMARWRAEGGPVTAEATAPPAPGDFRLGAPREEVRSRLPEFLTATGDAQGHAVVDALGPDYHFGASKFFDRNGHVPNAKLLPAEEFFRADKTFKSPEEIRQMARHAGIRPEHVVHSHCGGGVAAAVPWFALHVLAGQPQVKLYLESQREWLRDPRGLPMWTYDEEGLRREARWVHGWNAPMIRMFGVAQMNLVDVRPAARYAQGHLPFSVNVDAATFRRELTHPERLAALLGPAGVNSKDEVVLIGDRALTPDTALAFLALEAAGHPKVSVLMDSVDEWGLLGFDLVKQPTVVGRAASPKDQAVPLATYTAAPRDGVLVTDGAATRGLYPKVYVATGALSAAPAVGQTPVITLPHTSLVTADGKPRPAAELWTLITKAGVPRRAEVVLLADDVADAAMGYYLFRLMGWTDVKVWARG